MMLGFAFIVSLLLSGSLGATIEKQDNAIEKPSKDGTIRLNCNPPAKPGDPKYCPDVSSGNVYCCNGSPDGCFPESSRLLLASGDVIKMADLKLGDIVMAGTDMGNPVPSRFLGWLDKRPTKEAIYLSVKTQSGHEIRLTSGHGIAVRQNGSLVSYKFAGDLLLNDEIILMEDLNKTDRAGTLHYSRVVNIQPLIETGAYTPLTEHGSVFVDGIQASCYAGVDHHLADVFLAPVRWFPGLLDDGESQWKSGVRCYVQILKEMAKWFGVRRRHEDVTVHKVVGDAGGNWKSLLSAITSH